MNIGLYLAASGAKAQMDRQSVITNNIANARTNGFKRDLVVMQARLNAAYEDPKMYPYRQPGFKNDGGGVIAVGDGIDLTQSTFQDTNNENDLAIEGKGFFTVQGENGEKLLTRDGRFTMDPEGRLLTMAGGNLPVLDSAGQPIQLNPDLHFNISKDGAISQADNPTGVTLGLMNVADPRQLVKMGGNLLRSNGALTPVDTDTKVLQGKLENSGVDPMLEIVNMMDGQRAFEANARMMTYQDTTMSELNTVGRVA